MSDLPQAPRQPDLMDGDRYSNVDIAKRMWETFNATGDRWFKYAAQRLERDDLKTAEAEIMAIGDTVTTLRKMGHEAKPVAWRSRRRDWELWQAHSFDPTDAIAKYGTGEYEIEPLYAAPVPQSSEGSVALADRIENMAGIGVLSDIDGSGHLDLNGQLSDQEVALIVAGLRTLGAGVGKP